MLCFPWFSGKLHKIQAQIFHDFRDAPSLALKNGRSVVDPDPLLHKSMQPEGNLTRNS